MSATSARRVLSDLNDGAVTIHPDGRMTIPSDITHPDVYRSTVRTFMRDGVAPRNNTSGDVTLTGSGRAALNAQGGAR